MNSTPFRPTSRSHRTPDLETQLNTADEIERCLHQDQHRTWGFVIYRCTYANADWAAFMTRLRYQIHRALEYYNGLDLLDRLTLTVFEDRDGLDGASTSIVRERFRAWTTQALEAEQGAEAAAAVRSLGCGFAGSQRYTYCIFVDADALESVTRQAAAAALTLQGEEPGYVNVLARYWEHDEQEERMEDGAGWLEDGEDLQDVGWMKVEFDRVMVEFYVLLRDRNDWYREYRRPPEIACA